MLMLAPHYILALSVAFCFFDWHNLLYFQMQECFKHEQNPVLIGQVWCGPVFADSYRKCLKPWKKSFLPLVWLTAVCIYAYVLVLVLFPWRLQCQPSLYPVCLYFVNSSFFVLFHLSKFNSFYQWLWKVFWWRRCLFVFSADV